jgi:hypothetical protein
MRVGQDSTHAFLVCFYEEEVGGERESYRARVMARFLKLEWSIRRADDTQAFLLLIFVPHY